MWRCQNVDKWRTIILNYVEKTVEELEKTSDVDSIVDDLIMDYVEEKIEKGFVDGEVLRQLISDLHRKSSVRNEKLYDKFLFKYVIDRYYHSENFDDDLAHCWSLCFIIQLYTIVTEYCRRFGNCEQRCRLTITIDWQNI